MNKTNAKSLPSFTMRSCRGTTNCPHAVLVHDPSPELAQVMATSGWDDFLMAQTQPIRHHHQFRMAVAACPNGCSQPHIVDFGLIATTRITLDPEQCSSCGLCVAACVEKALHLTDQLHLNESACLGCAACVRVCPTQALTAAPVMYRVLLGGRLGRHPRLAHTWGLLKMHEVPELLRQVLRVFMAHRQGRERLGDVIVRLGQKNFDNLLRA